MFIIGTVLSAFDIIILKMLKIETLYEPGLHKQDDKPYNKYNATVFISLTTKHGYQEKTNLYTVVINN